MNNPSVLNPWVGRLTLCGSGVILLCAHWLQLPGLSLAGVSVDWALIWVLCFSLERPWPQALIAGVIMGLVLDGMIAPFPTHTLGLALAGVLTTILRKYRFLQSETLVVALLAFGLSVLYETTLALQWMTLGTVGTDLLWTHHQRVSLASGLVTSLWAPLVWWGLTRTWAWANELR